MEVPGDRQQPGKTAPESFRKTLLTKCQNEFEKNSAAELKRDERLKEIEQEKDLVSNRCIVDESFVGRHLRVILY